MRSLSRKTISQKARIETEKYVTECYDEIKYEAFLEVTPELTRQTVALVLYALSLHGFGKVRLQRVMSWLCDVMSMPAMLGKTPSALDCMKKLSRDYDIDFGAINPRLESREEYRRKERK